MVRVSKSITIERPPEAVYEFWWNLENLPRFMDHLQDVRSTGNGRSHWIARAPAGQQVGWDAEIVDERPGELFVWRALPGSDIQHEGSAQKGVRDLPQQGRPLREGRAQPTLGIKPREQFRRQP